MMYIIMTRCVKINENTNTVINSIECESLEWCKTYHRGLWVELGDKDKRIGIGDIYYPQFERFSKPQLYPSWTLNLETFLWDPPIPKPNNDNDLYTWSEEDRNWVLKHPTN